MKFLLFATQPMKRPAFSFFPIYILDAINATMTAAPAILGNLATLQTVVIISGREKYSGYTDFNAEIWLYEDGAR